jgi:hypothetical protein
MSRGCTRASSNRLSSSGDDFDDILARLHHATDGIDQQALDGSLDRRAQHRTTDLVGQADATLGEAVQPGHRLAEFLAGLIAKSQPDLLDLAIRFVDRRLQAADLRRCHFAFAAKARDVALEAQQFHLGDGARTDQRLGHRQFARRQFVRLGRLFVLGAHLDQFLLTLRQLLAGNRGRRFELAAPRLIQAPLLFGSARVFLEHLVRDLERDTLGQRPQTRGLGDQRRVLHAALAHRRHETRLVDAQQDLLGFDDITLVHQNLVHDTAVEALQNLQLPRRNDLALAARDFVDLADRRPHDEQREGHADRLEQDARAQGLLLQDGVVAVGGKPCCSRSFSTSIARFIQESKPGCRRTRSHSRAPWTRRAPAIRRPLMALPARRAPTAGPRRPDRAARRRRCARRPRR